MLRQTRQITPVPGRSKLNLARPVRRSCMFKPLRRHSPVSSAKYSSHNSKCREVVGADVFDTLQKCPLSRTPPRESVAGRATTCASVRPTAGLNHRAVKPTRRTTGDDKRITDGRPISLIPQTKRKPNRDTVDTAISSTILESVRRPRSAIPTSTVSSLHLRRSERGGLFHRDPQAAPDREPVADSLRLRGAR